MMSLFEMCHLNGEIRRGDQVFAGPGSSSLGSSPARVIVPLSTQDNKWILTNKMLGENPAIDLQPIKGQYSSTKLQARSKVVRTFGVVRPFISQVIEYVL